MNYLLILNFIYVVLFFFTFNRISNLLNIYDQPDERKIHQTNISLCGGVFVFSSIFLYLLSLTILDNNKIFYLFSFNTQIIVFFITILSFFFIGLVDDKQNLSANKKAILFLILIIFIILLDPKLEIEILYFTFISKYILLQNFSFIFTLISIFLLVNAINMYDGANMQLGSYMFIALLYLSYKSNSIYLVLTVFPILLFLILNFMNKTFIGNSGAYFFGFFLSYLVIKIYNYDNLLLADEVCILLFYPIIDLIRLFIFRIVGDKNPFVGDKNHIHHILLKKFNKNSIVQSILLFLTIYPIVIYELFQINSLIILTINLITYFFLIRGYLFPDDNN